MRISEANISVVVSYQVDRPHLGNDELARILLVGVEALANMEMEKNCNVFFPSWLSGSTIKTWP